MICQGSGICRIFMQVGLIILGSQWLLLKVSNSDDRGVPEINDKMITTRRTIQVVGERMMRFRIRRGEGNRPAII